MVPRVSSQPDSFPAAARSQGGGVCRHSALLTPLLACVLVVTVTRIGQASGEQQDTGNDGDGGKTDANPDQRFAAQAG